MTLRTAIALAALALTPAIAHAADKQPLKVICSAESSDRIGTRLCTSLRDAVARSPRYRSSEDRDEKFYYFAVHMVSTPVLDDEASSPTASAVVLTFETPSDSGFMTVWVISTGANKVDEQARDMMAGIDAKIEAFIAAAKSAREKK